MPEWWKYPRCFQDSLIRKKVIVQQGNDDWNELCGQQMVVAGGRGLANNAPGG